MQKKKVLGLIIVTMILALAWPVLAQPRGPGGGSGPGGMGPRLYNPQTVTTIKGTIENLGCYGTTGTQAGRRMRPRGLVLKTDKGNINVHLGPPEYLSQQGLKLKVGDTLEVTGSEVSPPQQTFLLGSEVKVDSKTVKLRDKQGNPLWPRQGRGGMGRGGRGRGMQ